MSQVERTGELPYIPDNIRVACDINLGKVVENIEFDYQKYDDLLQRNNITLGEEALEVAISMPYRNPIDSQRECLGGAYRSAKHDETNTHKIGVELTSSQHQVNSILLHQTSHLEDSLKAKVEITPGAARAMRTQAQNYKKKARKERATTIGSFLSSYPSSYFYKQIDIHPELLERLSVVSLLVVSGIMAVASFRSSNKRRDLESRAKKLERRTESEEPRARIFAKENIDEHGSVISFDLTNIPTTPRKRRGISPIIPRRNYHR